MFVSILVSSPLDSLCFYFTPYIYLTFGVKQTFIVILLSVCQWLQPLAAVVTAPLSLSSASSEGHLTPCRAFVGRCSWTQHRGPYLVPWMNPCLVSYPSTVPCSCPFLDRYGLARLARSSDYSCRFWLHQTLVTCQRTTVLAAISCCSHCLDEWHHHHRHGSLARFDASSLPLSCGRLFYGHDRAFLHHTPGRFSERTQYLWWTARSFPNWSGSWS